MSSPMKYIFPLLAVLLMAACTSNDQKTNTTTNGDSIRIINRTDTIYVVRNVIITPANAYSDLFLDSGDVEEFIQQKKISGDDAERFRSFYNYRNLQFAWFSSDGLTEQARGFWNLQDMYGTTKPEKSFANRMDTLLEQQAFTFNRFDTSYAQTELSLTQAYLQFYKTHRDKLPFSDLAPEKTIPVKKEPELVMAERVLTQRSDTAKTMGTPYMLLKQKLVQYTAAAKQGGWQTLPASVKRVKKGASSADVALLKKRLQLSGDYPAGDTTKVFTDSLEAAVKSYQSRHSMRPSGLVTDSLLKSLNITVGERLRQILINIDRMQWIAVQTGNHIWVNIPD